MCTGTQFVWVFRKNESTLFDCQRSHASCRNVASLSRVYASLYLERSTPLRRHIPHTLALVSRFRPMAAVSASFMAPSAVRIPHAAAARKQPASGRQLGHAPPPATTITRAIANNSPPNGAPIPQPKTAAKDNFIVANMGECVRCCVVCLSSGARGPRRPNGWMFVPILSSVLRMTGQVAI